MEKIALYGRQILEVGVSSVRARACPLALAPWHACLPAPGAVRGHSEFAARGVPRIFVFFLLLVG